MARPSSNAVERSYLGNLWAEIAEMEREYQCVVSLSLIATTQRGVFTVELRALEMWVLKDNEPLVHTITKRLPDAGPSSFAGALWDLARKLCDMVRASREARQALIN
jgi:hypothetical protein